MLPNFLLPDQVVRKNGTGPAIELEESSTSGVSVTLGINRIIEQESLEVVIRGSVDGTNWEGKPLAVFPQKFYCGAYSVFIDLSESRDIRYLRAEWKVNRWGRGEQTPLFGIYVFAEPLPAGVLTAAV